MRNCDPAPHPTPSLPPLAGEVLAFLRSRGLGEETLARNRVSQQRIFVPASQREETVVAFPYLRRAGRQRPAGGDVEASGREVGECGCGHGVALGSSWLYLGVRAQPLGG